MNRQKKKSVLRSREGLRLFLILSCIVCMITRIPIFSITGIKTVAYYSYFYELYIIFGCILSYGMCYSITNLVRFRIKREQTHNAKRVVSSGLLLSFFITVFLGVLILFPIRIFSQNILHLQLTIYLSFILIIAILFRLFIGVLRGFFEGSNTRMPSIHGYMLGSIIFLSCSIFFATLFQGYGNKVAALLRVKEFFYAYVALGVSAGALFASILEFLYLIFVYSILRKGFQKNYVDQTKVREGIVQFFPNIIFPALPNIARILLVRLIPFIDAIFILLVHREGMDSITTLGNYYVKIILVIEVLCLLYMISSEKFVRKILYYIDREEYRLSKEKTIRMIKHIVLLTFPTVVFLSIFSGNILDVLYHEKNQFIISAFSLSSIMLIFIVFSLYFNHLLCRLGKQGQVLIGLFISFIVHVLVLFFFANKFENLLIGIAVAGVISFGVLCIISSIFIFLYLQIKPDLLHVFAFPIVCASLTGILAMLLNNVLVSVLGEFGALIIGLPFGIIVYETLLFALHSITEDELNDMPLGNILIWYGKMIRLL